MSSDTSNMVVFHGEATCAINKRWQFIFPQNLCWGANPSSATFMQLGKYPALMGCFTAYTPFKPEDLRAIFSRKELLVLSAHSGMAVVDDKQQLEIPKHLRDTLAVDLKDPELFITGLGETFQVWSPENWGIYKDAILQEEKTRLDRKYGYWLEWANE